MVLKTGTHIHFGESEFKLKSKPLKNEFISIHQNFESIYSLTQQYHF